MSVTTEAAFDVYDPEVHAEIYAFYEQEHDAGRQIFWSEKQGGFWVAVGYDAVCDVLRTWEKFSSDYDVFFFDSGAPKMPPIQADPPVQQEWRRILNPLFSPGQITRMEAGARAVAVELIDAFMATGEADLIEALTNPLPGLVFFSELVRVPPTDLEQIRHWVDVGHYQAGVDGGEAKRAFGDLGAYVYKFLEGRRAQPAQDDVIGTLFDAELGGKKLSSMELTPVIMVLLGAGLETTTNAAGNALFHLAKNPELRQRLIDNPSLIPGAVEEFLRYEGSLHGLPRIVIEDIEMFGASMKKGDKLLVSYAGANRDPKAFDVPSHCNIDRTPNRHVAFGVGVHRCIGSNLARMNLRVMLEEVLNRLPDYQLDPSFVPEVRGALGRGYKSLPVTFIPKTPAGVDG